MRRPGDDARDEYIHDIDDYDHDYHDYDEHADDHNVNDRR
ncbi:hypothetical protein GCM10009066_02890 [Halarchaeum salinum]|uniref:Uncharacterized protein n=1 Tax=Halarchaeum salinum TaxID=489912 RepID=A0AAV3S4E0_9EURY